MWSELVEFGSAVVTTIDPAGFPTSVRCRPFPDGELISFDLPDGAGLQPGRASLLCHSHDELLWNLRFVNLIGDLEYGVRAWVSPPTPPGHRRRHRRAPGGPPSSPGLTAHAGGYLDRRGLERPAIPWSSLEAIKDAAIRQAQ